MKIFYEKPYFFAGAVLFWLCSIVLLIFFPKADIHLAINKWHTTLGDWIFPKVTYLGEAITYVLIGVILLYKKHYTKLQAMFISLVIHIVAVQILKNVVFKDAVRPKLFFQDTALLNFVEGVEVHSYMSFPSGHTATAFSAFALIAFFHRGCLWEITSIIAAIAVAFSRMYLQQHFLIDVFVGSLIGTISATIAYSWFNLQNRKTLRKS